MSYRVEAAKSGRAGCQNKACRDRNVKIGKGELRLGTWLELPQGIGIGHGSWKWKHWGCVSGLQLQHIRDQIATDDGKYDWDSLDGYDEMGDHPEYQEKIRRVIDQGFIDPEDFNGDPAYNKIGSRGIGGRFSKEDDATSDEETASAKGTPARKKKAAKRSRKKADGEDANSEPARSSNRKSKTEAKTNHGAAEAKSAKKPAKEAAKRAAPVKAESTDEAKPGQKASVKKGRRRAASLEKTAGSDAGSEDEAPRKLASNLRRSTRARNIVPDKDLSTSESVAGPGGEDEFEEHNVFKKSRAKGGRADRKTVAEEDEPGPVYQAESESEGEPRSEEFESPPTAKKRSRANKQTVARKRGRRG